MRWPTKAPKPSRTDTTSAADVGGVFQRLGDFVVRWPWVVVACWVALAVVLPPLFPSLAVVAQKNTIAPLPASARSTVANQQMTAAFHEAGSDNMLLVLLTNEKGLGSADEHVYQTLVGSLRLDHKDVVMLQDFVDTPALRETLTSQDRKAWLLPIGLSGPLASPEANASISTIVQAGFVVGTGILLDTFLVRTITVPAMAVLVGRANWWPSRWRPRPAPPAKPAEQLAALDDGRAEVEQES